MQAQSPLPTSSNHMDDQFSSWPNGFAWDFLADGSSLPTVGLDLEAQAGIALAVSASYLTPHGYDNSVSPTTMATMNPISHNTFISTDATAHVNASNRCLQTHLFPAISAYANEAHNSLASGVGSSLVDGTHELHDEQSNGTTAWAFKMTPLLAQLTIHIQSVPRLDVDIDTDGNEQSTVPSPSRSHNSDHTFDLSESFIDLLNGLCSKLPPSHGSVAEEEAPNVASVLDEASYLLVCATYLRFLEMHHTVFH